MRGLLTFSVAMLLCVNLLSPAYGVLAGCGSVGDEQTSIIYDAATGSVSVDAPAGTNLTSINIDSAAGIFVNHGNAENLDGSFDTHGNDNIFKATFEDSFGDVDLGYIATPGLYPLFILRDLTVVGSIEGGGGLGFVDFAALNCWWAELNAGDANGDYLFNEYDLALVQAAGKYLTGQPANWSEGDWNGAPGGWSLFPPRGDGIFDQHDVVAALQAVPHRPEAADRLVEALESSTGGQLLIVQPSDGQVLVKHDLESPPVFDGMAAAGGRLFIAACDGSVVCLAGR